MRSWSFTCSAILLLAIPAVAKPPRAELAGIKLGMSEETAHESLEKRGTKQSEKEKEGERDEQESWQLKRGPWGYVAVSVASRRVSWVSAFPPDHRCLLDRCPTCPELRDGSGRSDTVERNALAAHSRARIRGRPLHRCQSVEPGAGVGGARLWRRVEHLQRLCADRLDSSRLHGPPSQRRGHDQGAMADGDGQRLRRLHPRSERHLGCAPRLGDERR